ncbi:non-ribosomal peptide synthetase [Nocardia acidivorans]|uniref:non-ribosomal peptide synthetase n=1 Tax=Nocardia acidivorans TaxID=404580 RepID=UPI000836ABB8|nr:non-ribosomal peptide synthetase [Nocardia acidivorans]
MPTAPEGIAADGAAAEGIAADGAAAERIAADRDAVDGAAAEVNSVNRVRVSDLVSGARRPLSPGQRRAWFLQQRDPSNVDLNVGIAYRLTGDLDAALLRAAVGEVVARHDILRTVYGVGADGEPFQSVLAQVECAWQEHDLADLSAASRTRRAEVLIRRILGAPFDPTAAPPIRFALIHTGVDECALILVAHALCWDDESWEIFSRDLSAAYNGHLPTGPALRYADLVARPSNSAAIAPPSGAGNARAAASRGTPADAPIIDAADSPATGAQSPPRSDDRGLPPVDRDDAGVEFWRAELSPLPEPLELPGHATVVPGHAPARRVVRELPAELLSAVADFALRSGLIEPPDEGLSPPPVGGCAVAESVLLAAFEVLMGRYTGAAEFLVSVPVSMREGESLPDRQGAPIGYLGNTVLLRAALDDRLTFAELVAAVRDSRDRAHAHRTVGIDRVVAAVNPERTGDRDGLDQMVRLGFGVRIAPVGPVFDGVTAARVELGSPAPRVPLRFTVVRDSAGAYVEAVYHAGRFASELVEQLLTHYLRLLTAGTAMPERRIGELDLLGAAEHARLLELSRGQRVPTPATTVVALFEERVLTAPRATALVSPAQRVGDVTLPEVELTYDGLNRRANRLAHRLIGQGLGSEDVVALRLSNSVEFVIAVLAVLKSGAAYLPIDPAYPDDRIDYLIADARPRLVLGRVELETAEALASTAPEHDPSDADRLRPLRPGNLAYVIYTSGSTGRPKGVPVEHAAIADHLLGFRAQCGMTAEDRLLQASSVSFDASLLDVFVTLTLGARLIIPRPRGFTDLAYIADLVTRYGVTVLHMVPSLLRTFLSLPQVSEWRTVRLVPVGGEALPGEIADRFTGVLDAELRNHYGPTEAVVSATHMPVAGPQGNRIVPIGHPNRNVDLYLLDERLRPVPPGVIGEIYLGGTQLARGYLDRAPATAERFVADPFTPGARLYRTGDLARRDLTGAVEFVGRADEQVKVRGYRIEPGEVQAALSTHPLIRDCVVTVVGDAVSGPLLAAYLVPESTVPELDTIRAHAAAGLPEYMVPAAYAIIDAIPLTEHGKLDRRALPEPVCLTARPYREPVTAAEIRLAALYGELFGRDRIGADDSFFELGGHSLLANHLVARIRAEFGFEIDVRAVFDTPAVHGLAAVLEATARDEEQHE